MNPQRVRPTKQIADLVANDAVLAARLSLIRRFAAHIKVGGYHLTNACNIRCKGCWFFVHDYDTKTKDNKDIAVLKQFVGDEIARGINAAIIYGGEPTLFPNRLKVYVERLKYIQVVTNGIRRLSRDDFPNTALLISLFGGGDLDDELRAIKPNGTRFSGLFDTALTNYHNDPRATWLYAITEDGVDRMADTVQKIHDNGNRVTFNFYSRYGQDDALSKSREDGAARLIDEAIRLKTLYPQTVLSSPYYIRTIVTGRSHWGEFGYDTCPCISVGHPAHAERKQNGNKYLPLFNTWAADCETINFCCTSGSCHECRDSQAVNSWMMVSMERFLGSKEQLVDWVEIAEGYWQQFCWYPYRTEVGNA